MDEIYIDKYINIKYMNIKIFPSDGQRSQIFQKDISKLLYLCLSEPQWDGTLRSPL